MRPHVILAVFWMLLWAGPVARAEDPDIDKYLARVGKGEAEEVRSELPSLLSRYPNNPGVLYLQGVLTTDGTEAVRIYQSIVDNFPQSEWADNALYKVYQFYYAIGLYRTAEIKLNQLKTEYPQSKYLATSTGTDTKSLPEEKLPSPSVASGEDTSKQTPSVTPDTSEPISRTGTSQERSQYTLQVGAYSQQVNAEKQRLFFEDLGYTVEIINKVSGGRSLFVVLVGEYGSSDAARQQGAEFKKTYNINSMVVMR